MKIRKLGYAFLLLFSLTLSIGSCGLKMNDQSKTNKSPKTANGTIFLLRELDKSTNALYHAIYIDTSEAIRNQLTDFSLREFDSSYFESIPLLKPFKSFNKEIKKSFPRKWISIHQYKNEYFLYSPCDFCYHRLFEFTDSSTFEKFSCESPEPSRINHLQFQSSTNLIIDRSLPYRRNSNKLQINIIDPKKGIAVFTFGPDEWGNEGFRFLMVDVNKAHLFRAIVNNCIIDRQDEFVFDSINYKSPLFKRYAEKH